MGLNPHNILKHELIGLEIEITDSANKTLIGFKGKIIDETKNTITVSAGESLKKVLKAQIVFETKIDNKKVSIEGKKLVARPEDRLKR